MKGAWTNLRNGSINQFKLRFRSRKTSKSETFYVRSRWIEQNKRRIRLSFGFQDYGLLSSFGLASEHGRNLSSWIADFSGRGQTNEYYLCIPQSFEVPSASEPLPPNDVDGGVDSAPVLSVENQDQQKQDKLHITTMGSKKKVKWKRNLCLRRLHYVFVHWSLEYSFDLRFDFVSLAWSPRRRSWAFAPCRDERSGSCHGLRLEGLTREAQSWWSKDVQVRRLWSSDGW